MYRIAINSMATGKLPQGDPRWANFNDSFANQQLSLIDIANEIYLGHAYTTWHNGRRKLDNFICAQHIAIDMDTDDDRSTIEALEHHDLVRMYGGMIHTTPSHTTEAPRARVIFFLDTLIESAAKYSAAAEFLLSQFDGADTACKDASRFFYGSKGCSIALLDNVLPLAHLRHLYGKWKPSQPAKKSDDKIIDFHNRSVEKADVTSYDRKVGNGEPVDKLEEVRSALAKVDPFSVDYNRWIGIIASLKREFGDSARGIAEQWAQGKDGEVDREWNRVKADHGKTMNVNTIFYLAKAG